MLLVLVRYFYQFWTIPKYFLRKRSDGYQTWNSMEMTQWLWFRIKPTNDPPLSSFHQIWVFDHYNIYMLPIVPNDFHLNCPPFSRMFPRRFFPTTCPWPCQLSGPRLRSLVAWSFVRTRAMVTDGFRGNLNFRQTYIYQWGSVRLLWGIMKHGYCYVIFIWFESCRVYDDW